MALTGYREATKVLQINPGFKLSNAKVFRLATLGV